MKEVNERPPCPICDRSEVEGLLTCKWCGRKLNPSEEAVRQRAEIDKKVAEDKQRVSELEKAMGTPLHQREEMMGRSVLKSRLEKGGPMKIMTDNHFHLVFRFFEVQGLHIVEALGESGIKDEKRIRAILTHFLSSMACDLDQYYIQDTTLSDKRFHPMICFRDAEYIKEAKQMVIPDGADMFHETMPYGVVDEIFDMREKKLGFTYGNECTEVDL